jgi:hypothetical protein
MKMLIAATLAATALTAGMSAGAAPAAAATTHCGCPVVHHPVHRVIRHKTVYRRERYIPAPVEASYAPPPEPVYDEPVYDAPPPQIYEPEPIYYGGPVWFGGGVYRYHHPYWGGGWSHGHGGWGHGHFHHH